MRLGHAHVGLKHMYDCVLKAVVTYILLENLGSKKRIKWSIDRLRADVIGQKTVSSKRFYNDNAVINGLETKISRTFLDFLHLGHEFFVISGHGT